MVELSQQVLVIDQVKQQESAITLDGTAVDQAYDRLQFTCREIIVSKTIPPGGTT